MFSYSFPLRNNFNKYTLLSLFIYLRKFIFFKQVFSILERKQDNNTFPEFMFVHESLL